MSCRLDLPPRMLSLSPSTPHPLSKKSDIKQARKKCIFDTSLSSHRQVAPQDTVCSNIIHTKMRMQSP